MPAEIGLGRHYSYKVNKCIFWIKEGKYFRFWVCQVSGFLLSLLWQVVAFDFLKKIRGTLHWNFEFVFQAIHFLQFYQHEIDISIESRSIPKFV